MPPSESAAADWRDLAAAGMRAFQAGQLPEASKAFEQALQARPADPELLHMLGVVRLGQNRVAEAAALLETALDRNPQSAAILANLGRAYFADKKADQAVASYRKAIALNPNQPETHYNLGNTFFSIERFEDAIASYRRAIALRPDLAVAHYNLGNAHQAVRNLAAAEACYREAVRYRPNHLAAHSNLGTVLFYQGRVEEAAASLRTALNLNLKDPDSYYSLANVLVTQNKLDEAAELCRKGLALAPESPILASLFVHASRRMCLWEGSQEIEAALVRAALRPNFDGATFPLLSLIDDPAAHLAAGRAYARNKLKITAKPLVPSARTRDKIRIAYCSADFNQHVMSLLFAGLFERHDREAFEVYGVNFGRDDASPMRQRVMSAFDKVVDIRGLSDRAAAEQLRALDIDIAIDMKGYTRDNRAGLFAHRIAPIQVNYVGYPATMGADFMDYILVDPFVAPSDHRADYAERLAHMPRCYWINDAQPALDGQPPRRADHGLPDGAFVFCSFSNSYKITPEIFNIWMRLLQKTPGSVLWLLRDNAWVEANLRGAAQKRGVDPARLIFGDRMQLPDHLARHQLADLGLDTFPYNGHTTVSDALWMGLPVVTYAGKSFAARVAGSMLLTVDMPELITGNLADYEALALELAQDRAKLAAAKAKLAANKGNASLFDVERTTRDIENAYRLMMKSMLAGEGLRPIAVTAS